MRQRHADTNPGFQPFGFAGGLYDRGHRPGALRRARLRRRDRALDGEGPAAFGGGDTNLYAYATDDPMNQIDPSGLLLDTLLDIGFIAYDLFDIGRSMMNGCGVSGSQWASLGADVAAR